jgi:transcriptional regulator GlxA family with amidase domain
MSTLLQLASLLPLLSCHSPTVQEVAAGAAPARERLVAILVYEGVELLDFSGPGEVFAAAHDASGNTFRACTVAKTKAPVRSQGFVTVTPEYSIADCPAPDIVVVPGGSIPDEDPELQRWVKRCAESSELVMSVCNGAFLLAEAGLLDGKEATTHHGSLQGLTGRYPKVRVLTNRRFVDSGPVMTCAGVSAGIDGALHVVERLLGAEAARRTARYMEYDWRPDEIAAQLAEPGKTVTDGPGSKLAKVVQAKGVEAALADYRALSTRPTEQELNADAYGLLFARKAAEARALLELVVAAFPDSANARDSLSEACEALGDSAAAIRHAEEALAKSKTQAGLDPKRAERIQNASQSRLARLGKGDKSALRYACTPCGNDCDAQRYVKSDRCPRCGMAMVELKPAE